MSEEIISNYQQHKSKNKINADETMKEITRKQFAKAAEFSKMIRSLQKGASITESK
jgi:PDZ domain-containing secreted protein